MNDSLNIPELKRRHAAATQTDWTAGAAREIFNAFPALIARLKAAEAAMRWRPIEEAPKDGTPVLLFVPALAEWPALIEKSHWHKPPHSSGYWWNLAFMKPTRYMPLPAPPEATR